MSTTWPKDADRDRLLSAAIQRWGRDAQTVQVVEEMGELLTALGHFARGRVPAAKVVEEMADVQIMLWQLELLHGPMQPQVEAKLRRLRERLASRP